MAEKIEFDLSVKNNQLDKALDSGIKKTDTLEASLTTALGVFGGALLTKGFDLFIDGVSSIVDVTQDAIRASAEQEVALNNLNASLGRAGNLTRETSLELQNFATQLQSVSTFEDDATLGALALLQSLTKLDKDGLKAGVASAADFATVLGIDLETATRLVAKAAEGNTEAFKRYGVEINKGKNDSESFANTIKALNEQFGGAAQSQLNTYAGSTKSLSNSFGELLEPIGDVIVKNEFVVSTINQIKSVVESLTRNIEENKVAYTDLVTDGLLYAISFTQVLLDAMDGLTVTTKALFNVLVLGSNVISLGIIEPFRVAYDVIVAVLQQIPLLGKVFEDLKNPLDSVAATLRDNVATSFDDLTKSADSNIFRELSDGAASFADGVIVGAEKIKLANTEIKNSNKSVSDDQQELNDQQLASLTEFQNQKIAIDDQFRAERKTLDEQLAIEGIQNEFDRNEASIVRLSEFKFRENEIALQAELAKNQALKDARLIDAANAKAYSTKRLADQKATTDKEIALEKLKNSTFLSDRAAFFNSAASLSNSKSKELAAIGKAAAIVNATIAGREAIVSSFRFGSNIGGPPLGFTFAGIAAAATASQIAQIAAVQFENGGVVGATSGPDNQIASIRTGELILNASQQKTLFDAINSGSFGGGDIVVKIDSREIARATRDQIRSGFILA